MERAEFVVIIYETNELSERPRRVNGASASIARKIVHKIISISHKILAILNIRFLESDLVCCCNREFPSSGTNTLNRLIQLPTHFIRPNNPVLQTPCQLPADCVILNVGGER